MCHFDAPSFLPPPDVDRTDVTIPLPDGAALPALLARPEGGRGPAVLLVSDVYGSTSFYVSLAAQLAAAGFVALLPDLFFREGPLPENTQEQARARRARFDECRSVREMSVALDWLRGESGTTAARLGTIGFCMGGTFVLDLAAERSDLATVCYYGFPAPIAHATPMTAPVPLDLVDRINGPILGLWGDQDAGVGMPNVERFREALAARGVDFECVIYPDAGHGFMGVPIRDPSDADVRAARDAWPRTLDFLRTQLAG